MCDWGARRSLRLNLAKCAVMQTRVDRRQRRTCGDEICGIALVDRYTFLGVLVDDCCRLDLELERRKEQERRLEKMQWILRARHLSDAARYHLWQVLFRSRLW